VQYLSNNDTTSAAAHSLIIHHSNRSILAITQRFSSRISEHAKVTSGSIFEINNE
jgi:hypothetical protein